MRVGQALLLMLVATLVFAGSASSTHDPKARYAGRYDLDPFGKAPGKLSLRLVSESAGMASYKSTIVVTGPECRGVLPAQWYIGSFSTPSDSGPVVGCADASFSGFIGNYKSKTFGGKVGRLKVGEPRDDRGLFDALTTAAGDHSAPYEYFNVPIRFADHFAGDGSKARAIWGRFAFRVDGPSDHELLRLVPGAYTISRLLFRDHISGSGSVEEPETGRRMPATGTIRFSRDRKLGIDRHLTLAVEGTATASFSDVKSSNRVGLVLQVHLPVEVRTSDDSSCKVGRRGTVVLEKLEGGAHGDRVLIDLCGYKNTYSDFIYTAQDVPFAAKVVVKGEPFLFPR